jgi:monoamine oxidase
MPKRVFMIVICLLGVVIVIGSFVIFKDYQQISGLKETLQRDEALYPNLKTIHKYPIDGTFLYATPEK